MKRSFEELVQQDANKAAKQAEQIDAARAAVRSLVSQWDVGPSGASTPSLSNLTAPGRAGLGLITGLSGLGADKTVNYPKDHVGRIIGPAGKTVQELRQKSGCKIKISNDVLPNNQQAVTFSGTEEQVSSAMAAITELLAGAPAGLEVGAVGGAMTEVKQTYERDNIGKLIGAGGSKIQELRQRSGAKIQIANEKVPGTNSQAVTIAGTTEAVQMALALIAETIADPTLAQPTGTGGGPPDSPPDQQLSVPQVLMGRVIGPSGTVIKSIRDKSGAKINVGNECLPGTQDQPISLWGTEEQLQAALTMINTVIATATADGVAAKPAGGIGGVTAAPGETTQTYTVSKDIIKRIIGPGGSTIQKVRELSGARVKVGNDPIAGTDNQPLTLTGTESQVQTALAMVNEIATNPAAPGASGTNPNATGGTPKTEEKHAIPAALVGRIIGHGGDTIKKIRDQSGCKLQLANEPMPGTEEHALTITGTSAEIQVCLMLINGELQAGGGGPIGSAAAFAPPSVPPGYGLAPAPQPPPGYAFVPQQQFQPPPGYMLVPAPDAAAGGAAAPPAPQFIDPSYAAQYAAYTGYAAP